MSWRTVWATGQTEIKKKFKIIGLVIFLKNLLLNPYIQTCSVVKDGLEPSPEHLASPCRVLGGQACATVLGLCCARDQTQGCVTSPVPGALSCCLLPLLPSLTFPSLPLGALKFRAPESTGRTVSVSLWVNKIWDSLLISSIDPDSKPMCPSTTPCGTFVLASLLDTAGISVALESQDGVKIYAGVIHLQLQLLGFGGQTLAGQAMS